MTMVLLEIMFVDKSMVVKRISIGQKQIQQLQSIQLTMQWQLRQTIIRVEVNRITIYHHTLSHTFGEELPKE